MRLSLPKSLTRLISPMNASPRFGVFDFSEKLDDVPAGESEPSALEMPVQPQIVRVLFVLPCPYPTGPAQLRTAPQLQRRAVMISKNQIQTPSQYVANVIAHDGEQPDRTLAARQHRPISIEPHRSEDDSELVLATPTARASDH